MYTKDFWVVSQMYILIHQDYLIQTKQCIFYWHNYMLRLQATSIEFDALVPSMFECENPPPKGNDVKQLELLSHVCNNSVICLKLLSK